MSIQTIDLNIDLETEYNQYLEYDSHLKDLYGEINTPFWFINKMLAIIPKKYFEDKTMKWLDAGAGHGNYSICLYFMLFKSLVTEIPNETERKEHILKNMIYMIEVNPDNIFYLKEVFGEKSNIIHTNYLNWDPTIQFDFIIGNPPYNCNGVKKVPTKSNIDKKDDGKTVWCEFIKKNLSILKPNGMMNVVIPSIWMKPDKAGIYDLLLTYKIDCVHCLNASEVNKLFNYHVQTPICYFLLTKIENQQNIGLYDSIQNKYINFTLIDKIPIPLCFPSIVNKCLRLVNIYGKLDIIKTNMPKKNTILKTEFSLEYPYKNIHTTLLNVKKEPILDIKYSKEKIMFNGEPKIVMAHKMYGFPYLDKKGEYGVCSRDNYIIHDKSFYELQIITEFLSTNFILFLFETTRYRMRYLERYVFDYIPDFSKIPRALEMYSQNRIDIYELIGIDKEERNFIERYHKIHYNFFKNSRDST